MTNKEKDIWAVFNELNSMLYEVMGDFNKAWAENIQLKKDVEWYKKYTDALVEHKDMVCLPADLKNLREANAKMAIEIDKLRKVIESNQEDGCWHKKTTVDESDQNYSSDDFGYKSVFEDEVAMQRPTDEELTNLFMDTPVNSDVDNLDIKGFKKAANDILNDKEKMSKLLNNTGLYNSDGKLKKEFDINHKDNQELDKKYLNPQKHIGGDNIKKDIDFSGDDMVKAVNEYADSLKVKNLSAENEKLKVFLNRFLSPEDLGYAVSAYIRDEVRVVLGYERVESNRYKT